MGAGRGNVDDEESPVRGNRRSPGLREDRQAGFGR
jgi:hypothetical protein